MPKEVAKDKAVEKAKKKLGKEISKRRAGMSQRELGRKVGLSSSNMKYIEDGVNAPTAEIYQRIIYSLQPTAKDQATMDELYSIIRGTPPPDVCKVIINNSNLNDAIRLLSGQKLTDIQISKIKELFISFNLETIKGDNQNV